MDSGLVVFIASIVILLILVYAFWLLPEGVKKAKASAREIAQKEWAVYSNEVENGTLILVLNADILGHERLFAEVSGKHGDFSRLSSLERFDRIEFAFTEKPGNLSPFDPWSYLRLKP